uniref:Uncharacterized XB5967085 n=1 Tax=Xenopus tropicalis TaxID=8364 RepID=A0A803JA50_XENTR
MKLALLCLLILTLQWQDAISQGNTGSNSTTTKSPGTKSATTKYSGMNPATTKRTGAHPAAARPPVRATTKHSVTKPAAAQGLKCYSCNAPPPNCYKKKIITCEPGQDRCVKTTTKIVDYDGSPNEKNEFDKFMNVLVWERVCMTAKECEAYKQRTKIRDVTCCNTNLCNA